MMDCDDENDNGILKNNNYLTLQGPDSSSHNIIVGDIHKTTSNEIAATVPIYLSNYPNNQPSPVYIHLNSSPSIPFIFFKIIANIEWFTAFDKIV